MTCRHYSKLRGEKVNWLVPPQMQAMISGVQYAKQGRDGIITLTYCDGTEESRPCDKDMVQAFDGFLPVVSFVQAGRQP